MCVLVITVARMHPFSNFQAVDASAMAWPDREVADQMGDSFNNSCQDELLEHVDGLKRYALLLTGNANDAEDLVQEALLRVLAQLRSWRKVKDLRRYLFSTLHNAFVDLARRRRNHGEHIDIEQLASVLSSPANQPHHVELLDLMLNLQKLSPEQRQVILLVGYEGMSYQETASMLEIPIGTVMSRLSRARDALRKLTDIPENIGRNGGSEGKPKLRVVK
jgi:RNA polymerase sigma-70 factor (ECF subfamily)